MLWYKAFCELKMDLLNMLIKNVLMEEKTSMSQYAVQDVLLKWQIQNDLKLVFAVAYKEILHLQMVEELLEMLRYEFVTKVYSSLERKGNVFLTLPNGFDGHYAVVQAKWEAKVAEKAGPKKMKTFAQTNKGKKVKEGKKEQKPSSP